MDEKVMQHWDEWRKYISEGGTASWPRDAFENLIDSYEDRIKELEESVFHWKRCWDVESNYSKKRESKVKELEETLRIRPICHTCWNNLEPDGSCLTCRLEKKVKELEAENKDLKFKLSCHASTCIADYEQLEKKVKELEEGIKKVIDNQGDGIFTDELKKLVEKE